MHEQHQARYESIYVMIPVMNPCGNLPRYSQSNKVCNTRDDSIGAKLTVASVFSTVSTYSAAIQRAAT